MNLGMILRLPADFAVMAYKTESSDETVWVGFEDNCRAPGYLAEAFESKQ